MLQVGTFLMILFAFQWTEGKPEDVGMSPEKLDEMCRVLRERSKLDALMIIRHDRVVYEWYGEGYSRHTPHYTASLAKALVGGISLIMALGDGRLRLDDPACKFVPRWRDDPIRSRITLFHLATHSSGIEDSTPRKSGTWKERFWRYPHHYEIARDIAPVLFDPGTKFHYSNPGMAMLAYCISAAYRDAPEPDVKRLLRDMVMRAIGVSDNEWQIAGYGHGRPVEIDGLKVYANWGGAAYSPNAVARVGRLMLRRGRWEGRQILDPKWVERATGDVGAPVPDRSDGPNPRSGLCWWVNSDGVWEKVPEDAFAGAGAENQVLFVVPSLDLIVVRFGRSQIDPRSFWGGLERYLFNPVIESIR